MNIKQLKEIIKDLPDDFDVRYEYDGPETLTEIHTEQIYINTERKYILLEQHD